LLPLLPHPTSKPEALLNSEKKIKSFAFAKLKVERDFLAKPEEVYLEGLEVLHEAV